MPARFNTIEKKIDLDPEDGIGCLIFSVFFLLLLIYSASNSKYFWLIVSAILFFLSIKLAIEAQLNSKKLKRWFAKNHGLYIFFYPTNKKQQYKIQKVIKGKLSKRIAHVYYNGPKLIGDIKNEFVVRFMLSPLNMESPNLPKFLCIKSDGLELICSLKEFLEEEYDPKLINELIDEMNALSLQ